MFSNQPTNKQTIPLLGCNSVQRVSRVRIILKWCLHISCKGELVVVIAVATVPATAVNVCWFVTCLMSQQHASVSQGRICSDNFTRCHTEIEVADQTFNLTQSQYTDTGPTSPSADPITPGAWQGSHWSANV